MLDKRDIAEAVIILSLDAMTEFYDDIGIIQYDTELNQMFQQIVKAVNKDVMFENKMVEEFYGYSTYDAVFQMLASETNKLPAEQAKFLRNWLWNAHSGDHCSDISFSAWSNVLLQWEARGFKHQGYSEAEYGLIAAFLKEYDEIYDYRRFRDATFDYVDKNYKLSDYDRELHRLYEYNYDDDIKDPFIQMRIYHESYKIRKLVRESKILQHPDFPFDKLYQSALKTKEELGSWGKLSDIRTIKEFRREEYQCPSSEYCL